MQHVANVVSGQPHVPHPIRRPRTVLLARPGGEAIRNLSVGHATVSAVPVEGWLPWGVGQQRT